ncbi:MAG: hypothetical protein F4008_02580 [Gammaproteobacteria bacterium]|nr:hypothetical protein [Gammaproteobacteria bacterium]MYL12621.1 hypothetical protein [Gammaproteobacteria bacterium]
MDAISPITSFNQVYKINPHLKVIRITNNEIIARHSARSAFSRSWCDTGRTGLIGKLIGHLDGASSLNDLVERGIIKETEVEDAQSIIDQLREEDILIELDSDLVAVYLQTIYQAEQPFTQNHVGIIGCGQAGSRIARHLAVAKVQKITLCDDAITEDPIVIQRMLSIDPLHVEKNAPVAKCLAKSLEPYGVNHIRCVTEDSLADSQIRRVFEECDFVIVALDEYLSSVLHRANEHALNVDKPWASVVMDGSEGIAGPIYIPGDTCCFNEFEQQGLATAGTFKKDVLTYFDALDSQEKRSLGITLPPHLDIICGQLSAGVLMYFGTGSSFLVGRAIRTDFDRMSIDYEDIKSLPRCPACAPYRPFRHQFL